MAKPEPRITETPETAALRTAVEAGLASLDAGKSVPYEQVRNWLLTWGSENESSAPECR